MTTEPPHHDPMRVAQRLSRPPLPKRFYREAWCTAGPEGFVLTLDHRPALTPGTRTPISVVSPILAEAVAAEWAAQVEVIDPSTMPVTRIVIGAIDSVRTAQREVRDEIVRYAGSDLICYRAAYPAGLAARQAELWDPLVEWARDELRARLILAEGVIPVAQPPEALKAIERATVPISPLALAALSTATTLTGSAILALAVARGRLTAEEAWTAAHVDEDWQIAEWGEDAEAATGRANRWREMKAAAAILEAERI